MPIRPRPLRSAGCIALAALVLACAPDSAAVDPSSDSSTTALPPASDTTGDATGTTDAEPDTSTSASTELDSTGIGDPPGVCGDGNVDADEACDSGVANGTPGFCARDCSGLLPACGDGHLDPGERCDDGNTINGDGCDCAEAGVLWSYVGDEGTQILALRGAPDGSVVAVGDHGLSAPQSPLLWSFAADGSPLGLDESIFADGGQVELEDVDVDADGRWSIFGTGTNDGLGWLYRIDGDVVSAQSYDVDGIRLGRIGSMGTAIAPLGAVAWLDPSDDLVWQVDTAYVKTLLYDEDDDTVVALTNSTIDLPTLYRFDLDGNLVGTPVVLPDYGGVQLAAVGDGYAFVGAHGSTVAVWTVHRYDADFAELWSYDDPDADWLGLGGAGDTTFVAGRVLQDGLWRPCLRTLDAEGNVVSTFAADVAAENMDAGVFIDVDVAPDGTAYLGGMVNDSHTVPGQPVAYAYAVALVP